MKIWFQEVSWVKYQTRIHNDEFRIKMIRHNFACNHETIKSTYNHTIRNSVVLILGASGRNRTKKKQFRWTQSWAIIIDSSRGFCRHRCHRVVCVAIVAPANIMVPYAVTDAPVFSREVCEKQLFILASVRWNRIGSHFEIGIFFIHNFIRIFSGQRKLCYW